VDETGQNDSPGFTFVEKDGPVYAEPIPVQRGLSGYVIATGKALLVNDLDELDNIDIVHAGDPESSRSVLAVPMRLGGRSLACFPARATSRVNIMKMTCKP